MGGKLPSSWWVGASSAARREAAPVPSGSIEGYGACGKLRCGLILRLSDCSFFALL